MVLLLWSRVVVVLLQCRHRLRSDNRILVVMIYSSTSNRWAMDARDGDPTRERLFGQGYVLLLAWICSSLRALVSGYGEVNVIVQLRRH